MRMRRRPRPLAIKLFALLFVAKALTAFYFDIGTIESQLTYYSGRYPEFDFTRDTMIVITCARLTIAAIPVVLIWYYASNFAKWMATFLALLPAFRLPASISLLLNGGILELRLAIPSILGLMAVSFLFARDAGVWFAKSDDDAATFS